MAYDGIDGSSGVTPTSPLEFLLEAIPSFGGEVCPAELGLMVMLGCDGGIHGTRSGRDGLGTNGVHVVAARIVELVELGEELSSSSQIILKMIFMWFMLHMLIWVWNGGTS